MSEREFIDNMIEHQKGYISRLDQRVHSYTTKRYYELREGAAELLKYFWERRKQLRKNVL